jgi:hypothetical protein
LKCLKYHFTSLRVRHRFVLAFDPLRDRRFHVELFVFLQFAELRRREREGLQYLPVELTGITLAERI